ncbi:MAG: type I restriction endonuclease [Parerythrobacter sp.]
MAKLHEEATLETEICETLAQRGWLYETGADADYDRARALYTSDLIEWVRATQPEVWDTLTARGGKAAAEAKLCDRVRKVMNEKGTLATLRGGIEIVGARRTIRLAQFRPASGLNPEITARYDANRLRVIRQVHYRLDGEHSIDLVLFLNGIPTATIELKTDFTQSVEDAVAQYRQDRHPHPKGGRAEPLLSFPGGALVHFAVSSSLVRMTTKLTGKDTRFLPFDRGNAGGAGNTPDPIGVATSYLWYDVLQCDSWLDILGRYMVAKRDKKGKLSELFFPRYHQLDATRRLVDQVREEGAGGAYLIQHSAGSGKTASIAWTAHFLSELHDAAGAKMFATVIVVSDRRVIDGQLQDALFAFERTTGVVETIKNSGGAKSGQLADALAAGKKIIVCTIQTFPYALEAVREQSATQGKTFAVIADEAHSSQSGMAAATLRQLLASDAAAALADEGEVDIEDVLAAQMAARADDRGITYIAFTATPKNKTLELFGRLRDPDAPASEINSYKPFHVYSMRQAIEEGFILNVLLNYTPYSTAFRLAQQSADGVREMDEHEVERSAATKKLMRWVRLHPHNIAQKVQITVEHFRENVAPLLEGRAKAMVVLGSRKEAVRWKVALDRYLRDQGYTKLRALVAYSGEVEDTESFPEPVAETDTRLNPTLHGRDIRDAFRDDEARLLLVANKFQTGFDEPLLCGMYVDRRLAGVQAVQTLSRLNRAHPGKDTTFVLDFVNSADEVLDAFRTYYETAELSGATDPEMVFKLKDKLDHGGWYDTHEVERVVDVISSPTASQGKLSAALQPVAQRLVTRFANAREAERTATEMEQTNAASDAKDACDALVLMRTDMQTYMRLYSYLSQVIDYGHTGVEKRYWFYRYLVPLLEFERDTTEIDLSQVTLTHHAVRALNQTHMTLSDGEPTALQPISEAGSGSVQGKDALALSQIIASMNALFEGDLSDGDQLSFMRTVRDKLLESPQLRAQANANSAAQFNASPTIDGQILEATIEGMEKHESMGVQSINSARVRAGLKNILMNQMKLYELLKGEGEAVL